MKKNLGQKTYFFPQPVLIIATYNEDGSANAMNAAWGGIADYNIVELNLDPAHKTCENILNKKAFTISFATENLIAESDYLGIVTGNKIKSKVESAGLTSIKSEFVDAPIIDEYPVTLECEVEKLEYVPDGLRVLGKIINVAADDSVITDGKIDIEKLRPVAFDPVCHKYYTMDKIIADAFKVGKTVDKK